MLRARTTSTPMRCAWAGPGERIPAHGLQGAGAVPAANTPARGFFAYSRYLGNDFIFSFIAVALIPVYYARKSVGWLLAALLTVGSFAITTYDIIQYQLGAYVFDDHYRSYAPCCARWRRS